MSDSIVHALALEGQVRLLACLSTGTVEEARSRHNLSPTATAALGRTLTAAALLGALLKGDETVMLEVVGDGPLGTLRAISDARGRVRGYVTHPQAELPLNDAGKLNVGRAVGKGFLYVIRDLGLKEPYRGSVPLVSGEIAEDLAHYFGHSEQKPSAVALGVRVGREARVRGAGGYLIQALPGTDPQVREALEAQLRAAPPVSTLVEQLGEGPAEQILRRIFRSLELQVLESRPLQYWCGCSRDRFARALVTLGAQELLTLAEETGGAELVCRFCSTRYRFSAGELRKLAKSAAEGAPAATEPSAGAGEEAGSDWEVTKP